MLDIHSNMPMSLNGIEHMHIVMTGLHMMIYKASCLIMLRYLYFPKVWKCSYMGIVGL
jgi:hypothetical protein